MKQFVKYGKVVLVLFWIAVLANLVWPLPQPFFAILMGIAVVSLVAHIIESIIYARKIGQARLHDTVQILIFGAFHFMSERINGLAKASRA